MNVRESVPLSSITTFRVGGNVRYLIECASDELAEAIAFAAERKLPWRMLGQGSNLLGKDEGYNGALIHISSGTFSIDDEQVVAEAGLEWDTLVREVGAQNLWGIENLAGIPGTVGAAPVQNIGAYGVEIKDVLDWVEVFDSKQQIVTRLAASECAFGYRDSRFKHEPDLIIVRVSLELKKGGRAKTSYADLARLVAAGELLDTPEQVADAVRAIRAKKFPDLAVEGTAGSFFKNPILKKTQYEALKSRYPELPGFPTESGVKVPLAWILDRVLSLRGYAEGDVRLFEAQPLVIVARPGTRSENIFSLAHDVQKRVFDATNITLEWEVRELT